MPPPLNDVVDNNNSKENSSCHINNSPKSLYKVNSYSSINNDINSSITANNTSVSSLNSSIKIYNNYLHSSTNSINDWKAKHSNLNKS